VILRFLGTTPSSSSISQTLISIIYQICRIFSIQTPRIKFENQSQITNFLRALFSTIYVEYPQKKLVIILDSVDQLQQDAYNLEWVEFFLPPNIKMVYSTLPAHEGILQNFRMRGQHLDENENFLEVESLDASTAHSILSDWLKRESRRLSTDQLEIINKMFSSTNVFPLYVKVIFDIVAKWPSFFKPDQKFQNCRSIDECIMYLFDSLEFLHGKLLFTRTIIYMSVFKNGISESELEDILSLDDDVLYDIFEFHAPPIRKLPVALWSRIKHDLKVRLPNILLNMPSLLF
jgi:hypothetical protein